MANELSKYFGKDYLSNPQLVGLDANQKSNFTIITNKAKEKGITSNYAIAGLLGIVSKVRGVEKVVNHVILADDHRRK